MAKNKTVETEVSVTEFMASIADEKKRADCLSIINGITEQTGLEPKMWGPAIIGFGSYHYKYETGREGDMPLAGLSPRANAITFYLGASFDQRQELLARLGKYKTGKGCVYIQKLSDVDRDVLMEMVKKSIEHRKERYPD